MSTVFLFLAKIRRVCVYHILHLMIVDNQILFTYRKIKLPYLLSNYYQ